MGDAGNSHPAEDARSSREGLVLQALLVGGPLVPVVVIALGGPMDPVLCHRRQLIVGAALDHAPRAGQLTVVQPRVLHLACQNLAGRDHANIGTAGQPADIGIVVGGFGAVGKITQIPPKNSDLILDRNCGTVG